MITDIGSHFGIQGREISLDKDNIQTELESGHPIICAMRPGDFTTTGHFIVITGIKDGQFTVNDPTVRSGAICCGIMILETANQQSMGISSLIKWSKLYPARKRGE